MQSPETTTLILGFLTLIVQQSFSIWVSARNRRWDKEDREIRVAQQAEDLATHAKEIQVQVADVGVKADAAYHEANQVNLWRGELMTHLNSSQDKSVAQQNRMEHKISEIAGRGARLEKTTTDTNAKVSDQQDKIGGSISELHESGARIEQTGIDTNSKVSALTPAILGLHGSDERIEKTGIDTNEKVSSLSPSIVAIVGADARIEKTGIDTNEKVSSLVPG